MKEYPSGADLVSAGKCPWGAQSPVACTLCPSGHLLECHYPLDCARAHCSHYEVMSILDPYMVPDPDFRMEFDDHDCEICDCSELDPCENGCSWSEYFLERGRYVCSNCHGIALCLDRNYISLCLYRDGFLEDPRRPEEARDGQI